MKKNVIAFTMLACVLVLGTGFLLGRATTPPKIQNIFPPNYYTEDMPPAKKQGEIIQVVFADSVDGRPTYNVLFPDSTVLDSMYPEEIANGLNTGKWDYNEMLKVKEEDQ